MNITPYILIGGKSTRFGHDKATFEFEGETLAERAARIFESAFPTSEAVFVGKTAGRFLGREMIADIYADRGAAGAIHAALSHSATDCIFVLACDLPFVTKEFVEILARAIDEDHGCVLPEQPDGRWQPLCALYQVAKCLQPFEKAVSSKGRHTSLHTLAEGVVPRVLKFAEYKHLPDPKRLLINANSIADLDGI